MGLFDRNSLLDGSFAQQAGQSAANINNLPNVLTGDLSGANFATPQAARQTVYPGAMQQGGVTPVWMGGKNLGPDLAQQTGVTADQVPAGENAAKILASLVAQGKMTQDQALQFLTTIQQKTGAGAGPQSPNSLIGGTTATTQSLFQPG